MEAVDLLQKLVSINSIYPNEKELAEFLENYLKNLGFSVQRQYVSKDRFNLLAERGTGDPLGFYCHMDTVPVYGKWKNTPFELTSEEDELHGLGAWDMKAGIAAVLKAVETPTKRKIKIAFGVDEENISEGIQEIMKSNFFKDVEGVIVPEAGNSSGEHLGPRMITLGRRGRTVYLIEIFGKSAHGATSLGVNAALVASEIVQFLENQELREHELLPKASQFIRKIHSEVEGMSVPDYAFIELDRHLVPPETVEGICEELTKQLEQFERTGAKIKVSEKERKTHYMAPYITDRNSAFVKRIETVIREKYGDVHYNYGLSVADENAIAEKGIPVVTIGPKGADDHNSNEWVSKKSYLELIELFEKIIE